MGRAVSVPHTALIVAYRTLEYSEDELETQEQWDDLVNWVQEQVIELWPTFNKTDFYLNPEENVIVENAIARIGISEYCGVVAVWFVPNDTQLPEGVIEFWVNVIKEQFLDEFGTIIPVDQSNNGETIYIRKENNNEEFSTR